MVDTSLPFSEERQKAFIGHILTDDQFFVQCISYISQEWFINPVISKIYQACLIFYKTYLRRPNYTEISIEKYFNKEEPLLQDKIKSLLAECVNLRKTVGLDVIKAEIDDWFSLITAKTALLNARDQFNAGKIDDVWKTLNTAFIRKTSSSFESGVGPMFAEAKIRAVEEKFERIEQSKDLLSYNIKFLDDAMGAIMPNDLIMLGAKSNMGKTTLSACIAMTNAQKGKWVHYFSLEAEKYEIERRNKFTILAELFYKNVSKEDWPDNGVINYMDWRLGRLEALLAPFESEALEIMSQDLGTLHTLYRTSGDFNLETLDRHLSVVSKESDLIIIDHLHYVDIDGENENRAYKDIIKRIRDSVLKNSVPVLVVAHLRKDAVNRSAKALVPNAEDFHGSSDIFKIATSCVMIAPAFNEPKSQSYLWPTYVRPVKCRLESIRTRYTAVVDFNIKNNMYENPYRLGRLTDSDTQWEELDSKDLPFWARKLGR